LIRGVIKNSKLVVAGQESIVGRSRKNPAGSRGRNPSGGRENKENGLDRNIVRLGREATK